MAAAILQLSNWHPDKPLPHPTCGSSTFCIMCDDCTQHGARFKTYLLFEEWNWVDDRLIQEVRTEAAKNQSRPALDISGDRY